MNNVYIHPIDNYVKAISDQNKMVFEAQMKEITSNKINTMQEKIKNQKKLLKEKDKEIKRLINTTKEVREKIESVQILGLRSGKTFIATLLNDILEILDKENKDV